MDYKKIANDLKKNYSKKTTRTLRDMKNKYQNQEAVKKILKTKNPVIYEVYAKELDKKNMIALTIMNFGCIGNEFYMTKGHKHKNPFSEKYILISGKGKLIIQKRFRCKIKELKKLKPVKIPKKAGHRLVNIGNKKLEVIAIYNKNSGHDYDFEFKKRILKD